MPLTLAQLEKKVFELQDKIEELEEWIEILKDPHKRKQMTGTPAIKAKSSAELQEKLYTKETMKWSAIGVDPDLRNYVRRSMFGDQEARIKLTKTLSSFLFPFRDLIKKAFSIFGREGSFVRLKYRGSVVRAIKAYHKGTRLQAGAFNANSFDCDAFIEIPDRLWDEFCKAGFSRQVYDDVGNKIQGRTLPIDKNRKYEALPSIIKGQENVARRKRLKWWDVLHLLSLYENFIKEELLHFVPGYRTTANGDKDFEFYLRPVSNVWWTYQEGNPYFGHQELRGFSARVAGGVDEFCYKEIADVRRYAEEIGTEGKLAPDLQCVVGSRKWYIETKEVFDWKMADYQYRKINPEHAKQWKSSVSHNTSSLISKGKIVGGDYEGGIVNQIRNNPEYRLLLDETVKVVSISQY